MAIQNFHIILNKEERYRGKFRTSVVFGGVKEYYDSMKNIILYNSLTTKEIYDSGYDALKDDRQVNNTVYHFHWDNYCSPYLGVLIHSFIKIASSC